MPRRYPVFDLDGTLLDSDAALLAPFAALGVPPERVPPLGLPVAEACDRAGISLRAYLAHYDGGSVLPFPGVSELLGRLDRWAVCSNKARASGLAELDRLGWTPELALFSEDFDHQPKRLAPVLAHLQLPAESVLFVGDTAHDRRCAADVGVPFALAGWNQRSSWEAGDIVLEEPADLLALLG